MSHSESDAGKSKKWLKYVLVGDSGVGKTCLLVRFVDGEFLETVPTIAVDFRTKAISVGGETVKLQIWDTAGQERFRFVVPAYFRGALGAFCCFDVTQRSSFDNVETWISELRRNGPDDMKIFLIGCKADLEYRSISRIDAEDLAKKAGIRYFETSAMTGLNVDKVFSDLTCDVLQGNESIPVTRSDGVVKVGKGDDDAKKRKKKCC